MYYVHTHAWDENIMYLLEEMTILFVGSYPVTYKSFTLSRISSEFIESVLISVHCHFSINIFHLKKECHFLLLPRILAQFRQMID